MPFSDQEKKQLIQKAIDNGVPKEKLLEGFKSWDRAKKDRWYKAASAKYAQPVKAEEPGMLKQIAKGAVSGISEAAAVAGGLAGGALGAAFGGVGAAPGALIGAGLAGSAGEVLEKGIQKEVFGEGQGAEGPAGLTSAAKGAQEGFMMEAGGAIIGKGIGFTLNKIGSALGNFAVKMSEKSIPLKPKHINRLGGEKGVREMATLLKDEAVTSTPGTLRAVEKRVLGKADEVGKALGEAYKDIDKAAKSKYTTEAVIENTMQRYAKNIDDIGEALNEPDLMRIKRVLKGYMKAGEVVNHEQIHKVVRTLEKGLYKQATLERKTLNKKIAMSLRQANQTLAEAAGAGDEVMKMRDLSGMYSKFRTAADAVSAQLGRSPSAFEVGLKWAGRAGTTAAGGAVGGSTGAAVAGGALGAVQAASTTTAKTTAASLASFGSRLMSRADKLGPYGKVLARMAANKGFEAVAKRHAHLMMKDEKYRKKVVEAFPESYGDQSNLSVESKDLDPNPSGN